MSVAKTRELMIDVARQLFARIGVEKTTMNDIADAANKGRRTLYTYFKSKKDIYFAVVHKELDELYSSLETAALVSMPPTKKLMHFIYTHLEAIKEIVVRNGTLRADFFRDIWKVETARKEFDLKEEHLICSILDEGVRLNAFSIPDTHITAKILLHSIKGLEVPYISGHLRHAGTIAFERISENVEHLIFHGICLSPAVNSGEEEIGSESV
ncbi:TetR/AcrR family transcriptional regulator [Porphyromonas gingivalis]|uniref:TetR/AcrR family transcriptional regulator n=1 Tax=Porphyromonas gingivalis TaxID=837 RepID=UPI001F27309D|nr:TetR/AcrR family transcriptional regulator [Porphyromonas gingivalis]MCE8170532.1 TetR/AcrR family transcriptional regulator [Porphyromonas gingivalis]MCE8193868.1 TetR/AcrR family transcriptional regulator [Porphyromonas gingivalis]